MNIISEIMAGLTLALQFLPALANLLKQIREVMPANTPQQHTALASSLLAKAVMNSHPELVNGTTESMLTSALHAVAEHAAATVVAQQAEIDKASTAAA